MFLKVAAYNVEYSKNASAEEIGEAFRPFDFDMVAFQKPQVLIGLSGLRRQWVWIMS